MLNFMNDIPSIQNEVHFIELLKAQRVAYSQCKTFQVFDIIGLFIAILFPLLALEYPNSQNIIKLFYVFILLSKNNKKFLNKNIQLPQLSQWPF